MATYKDRIALPPVNAQKTNMTCHFCIVGCGYHVYKWDSNTEGGRAPDANALGLDFRKQLPAMAVIMTPAMTNSDHGQRWQAVQHHDRAGQGLLGESGTVLHPRRQDGLGDVYRLAVSARSGCTIRGFMLRDQWLDTGWDQALAVYGGLIKKILDQDGPSDIMFSASTTAVPAAASRTPGAPAS